MPFDEFYKAMAAGAVTKTSQVNTEEFITYFTPFLEQGMDILHVSLSSGLSGAFGAANMAKEALASRFPQRKIRLVDSLGASSGYGLLMDKLADEILQALAAQGLGRVPISTHCTPGLRPIACGCITGFSPPISPFTSGAGAYPRPPDGSAPCSKFARF